jgi:hypothetical protein
MAFNPVLPGASRSATIFGLYAIAMSIGDPPRRAEPVGDAATVSARAVPST